MRGTDSHAAATASRHVRIAAALPERAKPSAATDSLHASYGNVAISNFGNHVARAGFLVQ
jgi:hypothetical protein